MKLAFRFAFTGLIVALIYSSCNSRVNLKVVDESAVSDSVKAEDVLLISLGDSLPRGLRPIAKLKIQDNTFGKFCSFTEAAASARLNAVRVGANVIRIVKIKGLDDAKILESQELCYRFAAELYRYSDEDYLKLKQYQENFLTCPQDSALILVYRLSRAGDAVNYKTYLDSNLMGKMHTNSIYARAVSADQHKAELWAATEEVESLTLNVEKNYVYFVKASVKYGIVVGRPVFERVSREQALVELSWIEYMNR